MQPGTRVVANRDSSVHPKVRGRMGTVRGPGVCGTVSVLFDHDSTATDVERSVLEILSVPDPEPTSVTVETPTTT